MITWFINLFRVIYYFIRIVIVALPHEIVAACDAIENEKEGGNDKRVNRRLNDYEVHDKLYNEDHGLLKEEIAKYNAALTVVNFGQPSANTRQTPEAREALNESVRRVDPLKAKGDAYERFIGKQFEKKGDLVIYNGFISGYQDGGADLVVISAETKTLNLIQCKNWSQRPLTLNDLEEIYSKLSRLQPLSFYGFECRDINYYLSTPMPDRTILTLLFECQNYQIRKTLYIADDRTVDLHIGPHLTMTGPNIFKYKDMKLVVKGMS